MSKKKKAKNTNAKAVQKIIEVEQPKKSNTLILGGLLLAMSSIGLLIFVFSEKVFNLS